MRVVSLRYDILKESQKLSLLSTNIIGKNKLPSEKEDSKKMRKIIYNDNNFAITIIVFY